MPIVDIAAPDLTTPVDSPKGFAVTPGQQDVDHGSDAPEGSVLGAAFRQDNLVTNIVRSQTLNNDPDGTNPWDEIKGTKYEPYWSDFVTDRNKLTIDARKRKIDDEADARKVLEAAPWYQSFPAQLAAGAIDLPTLIPGGAFVRGAKGGFSVARSALNVGAAAGIATTAQEAGLQALQDTRPLSDSAVSVGASVVLGGLLGSAGAKLLSRGEWTAATRAMDAELAGGDISVRDAKPVFDDALAQLRATGMSDAEASANAAVVAARYATRAKRLGEASPFDLYKAEGVTIQRGGEPGAVGERTFEQSATVPTFYSAVERAVTLSKQEKASPDQWLGTLRNTAGVKPEETEWLGLDGWLKQQGKSVTKEQVHDYIRANQIEVKEVEKGATKYAQAVEARARVLAEAENGVGSWDRIGGGGQEHYYQDARRELRGQFEDEKATPSAPKYAGYQLPGGENYRELLLTLPPKLEGGVGLTFNDIAERLGYGGWSSRLTEAQKAHVEKVFDAQKMGPVEFNKEISVREDRIEELRRQMRGTSGSDAIRSEIIQLSRERDLLHKQKMETQQSQFKSSHFEEPNVLAHIRFNDRVIDGKKTLFLEEVQSDWHQAGRRKGYLQPIPAKDRPAAIEKLHSLEKQLDDLGYEARDTSAYQAIEARIGDLRGKITGMTGVPDAPFKTTWPELSLKRMIRYAAEHGYEKLAWTTGETQAARYDLSKQISHIDHRANGDGTYDVAAVDKAGDQIWHDDRATTDIISDTLGKEIADKIAAGEGKRYRGRDFATLEGLDLKVGGEGMLKFYDDILPATANRLVKKYGGRVGAAEVETHTLKIERADDGTWRVRDPESGSSRGGFATEAAAREETTRATKAGAPDKIELAHSIDITPALKDAAIEKGFPLFQGAEGGPRGRVTLDQNKAVIELFGKSNESTFMHEAGHLWLDELVRDASKNADIKADLDATLKWLGVDDASKIERKHHEQWARGFEEYLRDGRAPSSALEGVFKQFKDWLVAIYRGLSDLGGDHVPVNAEVRKVMDRLLATDDEIAARNGAGAQFAQSAGAAAVSPVTLEGNAIAGKMAGSVAQVTQFNPGLRLLQSPSPATRQIGTQLFENSVYLKKNFDGVASDPAVETLMKEWNGGLAKAVESTDSAFKDFVKAGGQMSRAEFREAVGKAMRRGDQDANPFVAKVAQEWRAKVFDPLKEAAIQSGLLPNDVSVETAASYFSRMWNRNKLIAQEGRFKGVVQQWVEDNSPKWAEAFGKSAERRIDPLRREIEDLEMGKLRRVEELKGRGDEIQPSDFGEADIRQAMRIVEGGAPKPKGVKTLTQFIHDSGGLVDFGGELRHLGISASSRPGFVRKVQRRTGVNKQDGGWSFEDMAQKAWEGGYFPEHTDGPPSLSEFLEALGDDFSKRRAVVRDADREAFRLSDLVNQLESDLARAGVQTGKGTRFATSDEMKGMVGRVFKALDAEADAKIDGLKKTLAQREAEIRMDREARFLDDPKEMGRSIADEVFNTLTGKTTDAVRPEFITIKSRGPLKERTFNIPDHMVEDFLEHNVDLVGRRYTRIMGADVELARKFGSVDMLEQLQKIRDDYARLRQGISDEKQLTKLGNEEKADIRDLERLRDLLRGTRMESPVERSYSKIVRAAGHLNYIRSMGEVVLASLTDAVRPAMVHGLGQFMQTVPQLVGNLKGIKLSVGEAKLAGNVAEMALGHRLATITDIIDPYASRGPVEAFLENMTNVASKWNGIRIWTDWMKSVASVMTQNRILENTTGFGAIKPKEKAYLAFLGIDQSMAERIAAQFDTHGETVGGVRVANTEQWTDPVAVRTYRAAMNKDVDSIIIQKSVADVPLFANTPTGKALLQFKSFALASHQRVLLRGLQEDQTRFIGGTIAMTAVGMAITYLKALSGNRTEKQSSFLENPGWWIGEGFDRAGILSVPVEIANSFEKFSGFNPIKSPMKAFDKGNALSQKNQNRNEIGSLLGPTVGLGQDIMNAGTIPGRVIRGEEITQGQKNAAERLLPFNSYAGLRQILRYVVNPQP